MRIAFSQPALPKKGAVVVFASEAKAGPKLTELGRSLDKSVGGAVTRALAASKFKGGKGEAVGVLAPGSSRLTRVVVVGLGKPADVTDLIAEQAGGAAVGEFKNGDDDAAAALVDVPAGCKLGVAELAAHFAHGATLRSYRFDKYLTKEKKEDKPKLARLTIQVSEVAAARRRFARLDAVAEGVFFTRDLVSEPANVIYPQTLAAEARKLSRLGVRVEVLDEKKMKALGFGALLGVAQGSARPPRLVVMRWNGGPRSGKAAQPIAFLGKGVTFDTGGISIKPSRGMEDMKWDMGGAGVVIGLMRALALRKAKANVIGIIGLVENMPSGTAQRPGDIVKSYSGQTIEVLNTDAEGRLVLADALWYCQKRFKPKFMVNLATLTGAIIVCLGPYHAGLFSNNDELAERLTGAGEAVGEKLWRMPLGTEYDKMIDSKAADVQNISSGGGAGSITAAQFLQRFVNEVPWAHLDIAGVTWSTKGSATAEPGGTGFGVRLLDRFVADHYETR
ncbi:MAG: leucyl aminopeptidase [Alphaproteobacteria bacterium]|nr:leucyl aminopeptidase [Alphaproteobacteria bacterium]